MMKRIFLFAVISLFAMSCKKDEPNPSEPLTSLEITVWDASKWSPTEPKGRAAAANVTLYRSQLDYANNNPAYPSISTTQGKAVFERITAGTYYVAVNADGLSNILNRTAEKVDGLYKGFAIAGIFQYQAEVNTSPTQTGAEPGLLKWADSNQDGVINDNDRVAMPYENISTREGTVEKLEVIIGTYVITPPSMTEQEFLTALSTREQNISTWHKNLVVADGLLSHQASIDLISATFKANFQTFGLFAFNPSTAGVNKIWQEGYNYIATLGSLLETAPGAMADRVETLARIRAMRAYIYLQLASYYGNAPLIATPGNLANSNRLATYNFIVSELQAATALLPQTGASKADMSATATKVLEAKAALLEKDYPKVNTLTAEVIASGKYSLASDALKFSSNSSEIIWNHSNNLDPNVKSYFMNRETLPYIRLSEVYLMGIEAALILGDTQKAQTLYLALSARSGGSTDQVTIARLRSLWQTETMREGHAYLNMIRWDTALETLSIFGYTNYHSRLPIPQVIIDQNQDMLQNPGY